MSSQWNAIDKFEAREARRKERERLAKAEHVTALMSEVCDEFFAGNCAECTEEVKRAEEQS